MFFYVLLGFDVNGVENSVDPSSGESSLIDDFPVIWILEKTKKVDVFFKIPARGFDVKFDLTVNTIELKI
jgi:hypothetical protein